MENLELKHSQSNSKSNSLKRLDIYQDEDGKIEVIWEDDDSKNLETSGTNSKNESKSDLFEG